MRRRGTAFVVALVMLFSTIPTGVFASEMTEFSDMPNDWSKGALEKAVENGLLKGDNGKIRANDYLTRAEMATIVNRGFNAADKASLNNFTDVAGDDWFYEEMQKAVGMKTFEGSGNKLNPRKNITREEAFVVLARAFKLSDKNAYELDSFTDSDMISSWAKDEVSALVSEGYVAGSGGKINPRKNITRAEFAQIMHNLVKTYINKEGEYTEDYQGNVMINRRNAILKGSTISGDLIIGDGVGDGDVTLDDVTVTGRLIVRGGGEDSIIIKGDSDIRSITIVKVKGSVRVYSQDGANIGSVVVDGTDNVVLEGKFNNVTVLAKDTNVLAKNANIQSVTVDGEDSRLTIDETSDVKTLNLNVVGTKTEISGKVGNIEVAKRAEKATVTVEKNGKVESIVANSEGTKITGSGEVKDVKANANNIAVDTKDTKVSAAKGTKGVTAGDKDVSPGKSETADTSKSESSSSRSSSSGGGGGGGGGGSSSGGSSTPTPDPEEDEDKENDGTKLEEEAKKDFNDKISNAFDELNVDGVATLNFQKYANLVEVSILNKEAKALDMQGTGAMTALFKFFETEGLEAFEIEGFIVKDKEENDVKIIRLYDEDGNAKYTKLELKELLVWGIANGLDSQEIALGTGLKLGDLIGKNLIVNANIENVKESVKYTFNFLDGTDEK